ncbi:MAG: Tol-Pal system beta propeller repeat protein TolB [Paracoccaceae bacterium]
MTDRDLSALSRLRRAVVAPFAAPIAAGGGVFAAILLGVLATALAGPAARAQNPLEITVAGAEFEPVPIALLAFEPGTPALAAQAAEISAVLEGNLERSGLFRLISPDAFLSTRLPFDTAPAYQDWRTIGADALVTGRIDRLPDGRIAVQFRVFDTVAESQIEAMQLLGDPASLRRTGHQVSDRVYTALTGESAYFDSQVVFVDETGPKGARRKRLAIMDQDGANLRFLPTRSDIVLTPRVSPDNRSVLYISYDTGQPQILIMDVASGTRARLGDFPGMSFAPRWSPDGTEVVLSLSQDGNTDLYALSVGNRRLRRLTQNPAIDTAPSFAPDGSRIVFESDRGGSQQLYVMDRSGGPATRISFGDGRYGTPVWSPKGDLIAFTKILRGRFHIGVMRPDGSAERLLTTSFLDEGPSFSPNGRVLAFYRESPGQQGRAQVMSVDVTGRNLRTMPTPNAASDPAWGALRQ